MTEAGLDDRSIDFTHYVPARAQASEEGLAVWAEDLCGMSLDAAQRLVIGAGWDRGIICQEIQVLEQPTEHRRAYVETLPPDYQEVLQWFLAKLEDPMTDQEELYLQKLKDFTTATAKVELIEAIVLEKKNRGEQLAPAGSPLEP